MLAAVTSAHVLTSSVEQLAQCPAAPSDAPPGLRERKKVATRQSLSEAAMRLAIQRGLDNVLVEDIAEAAGVSTRTFNNYFASKYEAICALQQDRAIRIGEALRSRPPGEPLWESVTHAVMSQFGAALRQSGPGGQSLAEWIAGLRLVVTSPALVGEYLKVQRLVQYHLAAAIAERLGTSLETDMFPRIMAGAVSAAMQAAMERWLRSDPPVPLPPLMREALRQFAEGMLHVLPAESGLDDSG
jgi:AcrR family transcriptional regulator